MFLDHNYVYRRVLWRDVVEKWIIAHAALKQALIIMKDFLLIKHKSFYVNSVSTSGTSSNFVSGCAVKPVPSSNVIIDTRGQVKRRAGYTNTTFSDGSSRKKQVSRRSGTDNSRRNK